MVIKWTVMKNRKAYENILSIILDELDIKMEEVKVCLLYTSVYYTALGSDYEL